MPPLPKAIKRLKRSEAFAPTERCGRADSQARKVEIRVCSGARLESGRKSEQQLADRVDDAHEKYRFKFA